MALKVPSTGENLPPLGPVSTVPSWTVVSVARKLAQPLDGTLIVTVAGDEVTLNGVTAAIQRLDLNAEVLGYVA